MGKTTIDLSQFNNVLNPVYIPLLFDKHRYLVLKGGTGSGKSCFACEKILHRIMSECKHRFLIIRKVKDTIRSSVFQLFLDFINEWGLDDEFKINQTSMTITFRSNGNKILFAGIDDPVKLKSITGITGIWIEEATELHLIDFQELDRRLRGIFHTYIQIILTYNPILMTNWTYERFFRGKSKSEKVDIKILTTTYKDNKFIDRDIAFKKLLEGYSGNMRTVFTLGEYGQLEHAIYTNWKMIPNNQFPDTDEYIVGLDFGYIKPQALVKVVIDEIEKIVYVDELSYKCRQDNAMLAKQMNEMELNNKQIFADSEAPDKIHELEHWHLTETKYNKEKDKTEIVYEECGFPYIEGCKKGKGSVQAGIDLLLQYTICITERSVNVKAEIEAFQRKKDKDGNVGEIPEKGFEHTLDAIRYVVYTVHFGEGTPYFFVSGKR